MSGDDDGVSNPLAPGDFANPLPPPTKPKGPAGAPPATPMSNNDFRKVRAISSLLVLAPSTLFFQTHIPKTHLYLESPSDPKP